jgi:hypothetical protein
LVVEDELTDRPRELVTLPLALTLSRGFAVTSGGGTGGFDRIGRGAELVRGNVSDGRRLARGVGGMARGALQIPGRAHGMTARRARLHHPDLTAHPSPRMFDRNSGS